MIRFTETNKWHDPWFMGLKHGSKLLFFYIIENCDNAGFYEINEKLLLVSLDITAQQFKGALKGLERGLEGPSEGWLRVKNFLKHQRNSHLNPANAAHKQIIALLEVQIKRFPEVKNFLPGQGAGKPLRSPLAGATSTGTGTRQKKGETEGKEKLIPIDPQAIQLAACVGRAPDTPWSEKEVKAWKALKPPLDHVQLDRLSVYYAKNRKKEKNICRRDLFTLLNNYRGECDRADAWFEKYKRSPGVRARITTASTGEALPTPEADTRYRQQFERWKEAGRPLGEDLEKFFPPSNGENEPKPKEINDPKKQ